MIHLFMTVRICKNVNKMMSIKNFLTFLLFAFLLSHCGHFIQKKPVQPRVGVIIGPGGALSLSSLGVLKTMQEYNISIDSIVGIGWGAWLAGVFAKNTNVDEVQWSLHKLLKRGFFSSSFLTHPFKLKNLSQELKENFKSSTPTKIPFSCPGITHYGVKIWHTEKFLESSVKKCLSIPPFFKKGDMGSPFSVRASIKYLQRKKLDQIIWINPIKNTRLTLKKFSSREVYILWTELRASLMLIPSQKGVFEVSPILKDFGMEDFSKMNDIILEGQKAGEKLVKKLQYSHLTL